jgi:hypothetical protein
MPSVTATRLERRYVLADGIYIGSGFLAVIIIVLLLIWIFR